MSDSHAQLPVEDGATRKMSGPTWGDLLETLRAAALGEYEVFAELGSGGMATVFLAHDIQLDRKVAIKVMLPVLLLGDGMVERFKLEARTAASLNHAHIIPIYAVKETEELLYFVMQFVDGRPLDSIIKEVGQLPIPMVQTVLTKVGEALGYAHRNGVVHRDIKPANIMIDVEGMPVVTDFGIAKVAHAQALTMTGATIGTPTYMSPEQCTGEEITGATDQYSLGVVAYEMLTGKPPFDADTGVTLMYKHCHESPKPVAEARPDCPHDLAQAVDRMLSKEPADRWPTMEEALTGIGGAALAFDDPVRTQMIDLALAGENRELLRRISTPRSPMPVSRVVPLRERPGLAPTDAETVKLASHQRSSIRAMPAPRRHNFLWATVGVALVATVVAAVMVVPRLSRQEQPLSPQQSPTVSLARIAITPPQAELTVGETVQLAASGVAGDGNAAGGIDLVWTSDDPAVAGVSAAGLVTALASGNAVISASGAGLVANSQITVSAPTQASEPEVTAAATAVPVTVAAVAMETAPAIMNVGETQQLRAVPRDRQGSALVGRRVAWTSDSPSIATVSASGVVSAVSAGTVTIAATSEGQTARVAVTVMEEAVVRVTIEPSGPEVLQVGGTVRLTATGWSERNQAIGGRETTWTSGNDRVATVSETGTATAVGPGETEIRADVGGRSATVTIAVSSPPEDEPAVVVDPREEIAAVIQGYARALESRDLAKVQSVFPSISADQASDLVESFESMRDLEVILNLDRLDVDGDEAQAEVSGTYQFHNSDSRRDENVAVAFQIVLRRFPTGWFITATR